MAVVADFNDELAMRALDLDVDQRAFPPGQRILNRALADLVENFRDSGWNVSGRIVMQAQSPREIFASLTDQAIQRELQSGAFDNGRIQFVADIAKLLDGLFKQGLNFGSAAIDVRGLIGKFHSH